MPSSDREVFEKLTGDPSSQPELDFITYALFAHERGEWIRHHEARKQAPPTPAEVDAWIDNLTDSQFDAWRTTAASFFDIAARTYLEEEIQQREDAALQAVIVREVRAAGAFWKQFAIALLTSILAPIIIGGVIAFVLVFNDRFPSIRDISGLGGAAPPPAGTAPAPSR